MSTWARTETSSPETASSATSSFGRTESARAIPTPLALAAGQLRRIAHGRGDRQADPLQQPRDLGLHVARRHDAVQADGLTDGGADADARVERGIGVLEHHLHLTPQRAARGGIGPGDVLALEANSAVVGREQAEHEAPQSRLAATGFTDEAEALATSDGEADLLRGLHPAMGLAHHAVHQGAA